MLSTFTLLYNQSPEFSSCKTKVLYSSNKISPCHQPLATTMLLYDCINLTVLGPYIMSSGFICVVAWVRISFLLRLKNISLWVYTTFCFFPSSINWYLGSFYLIAPVKTVAMSIIVLVWHFWGCTPGICMFNKLLWGFWCTLKCEPHCNARLPKA